MLVLKNSARGGLTTAQQVHEDNYANEADAHDENNSGRAATRKEISYNAIMHLTRLRNGAPGARWRKEGAQGLQFQAGGLVSVPPEASRVAAASMPGAF